jgi:hypothetical protein
MTKYRKFTNLHQNLTPEQEQQQKNKVYHAIWTSLGENSRGLKLGGLDIT